MKRFRVVLGLQMDPKPYLAVAKLCLKTHIVLQGGKSQGRKPPMCAKTCCEGHIYGSSDSRIASDCRTACLSREWQSAKSAGTVGREGK